MRLYELSKWQTVGKDADDNIKSIKFNGKGLRRVKVFVNAPYPTRLYRVLEGGEIDFLAKVDGFEEINFTVDGELCITADHEDVKMYCGEFETTSMRIPDAVAFVKIANRKQRNPELELMQYQMKANMEALVAAQIEELDRRYQRNAANVETAPTQPTSGTGTDTAGDGGDGADPVEADAAGAGDEGEAAQSGGGADATPEAGSGSPSA